MGLDRRVVAERVTTEEARQGVIEVLRETYQNEKRWVRSTAEQFPAEDLQRSDISWFLAKSKGIPAGVLRVLYNPPVAAYAQYGFKLIDRSVDVEAFIRHSRIAEIGRFAVMPEFRSGITVAAALMRVATRENVARGYTHLITDVFEDDIHSPYGFHTRVMGFRPVATHDTGELETASRRITLLLDLRSAYKRLRARGNWIYRYLTDHWTEELHRAMAA